MIAIVRIAGQVGLDKGIKETFRRLNLPRKYSCVLVEPTEEKLGMINNIKNFIAFGEIDEKTLSDLKEKREKKGKKYFALHPARGGIETKKHFPKGVLGNHKDKIGELIGRML
jgi:ribosomal protein L30/L7E